MSSTPKDGRVVAGILPQPTLTGLKTTEQPPMAPVPRQPARAALAELFLGAVVAAVVSLIVQLAVAHVHVSQPSFVPQALASLGGAVILGVLLAAIAFRYRGLPGWLRLSGTWAALSAFTTLTLSLPLESTRFYYGGSSVDNGFRLQYMTRMASTPALADMNYAHLAPYYPAGWFWLGGRFANLLGWEGWAAYKPYALMWLAITCVVTFTLWSLVVRRGHALLAALVTTLSGMLLGIDEPYAWPSAAWLAPVAVLTWEMLRSDARPPRWLQACIGGYVGFAAITYTLHFGFAVMALVVIAAVVGVLRVREGDQVWPVAKRMLGRLLPVGVVGLVISLVVWLPYLLATGFFLFAPHAAAQRYLPPDSAYLPLPMTDATPFGALCLAGLAWLLLRVRRGESETSIPQSVAAALLTVVVAVYCWFGLSTLALVAKTTLLAFRLNVILNAVLATAGVLGLVELIGYLRRKLPARYVPRIAVIACVAGLLGTMNLSQGAIGTALNDAEQQAYQDYYPTGYNSMGQHDTSNVVVWYPELFRTIADLTRRQPSQNVVLTTDYKVLSYEPYWGFQQETPHYANPTADYNARAAEIQKWSRATSSQQLVNMLRTSPFDPPDVFILSKSGKSLTLDLKADAFPEMPNVRDYTVTFNPALFNAPGFVRHDVGPYAVIVRG